MIGLFLIGAGPVAPVISTLEDFPVRHILFISLALIALVVVSGLIRKVVVDVFLSRAGVAPGTSQALGSLSRYLLILVGAVLILRAGGVDLGSLAVLAGAFSLGVGFGLQTIIHNFVSGLIILIERPIKVGDRIEIQHVTGRVERISFRSTLVITNDNIAVIVPNADLITSTVINWTQTDRSVRFTVPIGVSYEADPTLVMDLLMAAALAHPGVLRTPPPDVLLEGFGENSLDFQLRVWTQDYTDRPGVLKSELNLALHEVFRQRGIEIPFPQRVVHLRTSIASRSPTKG